MVTERKDARQASSAADIAREIAQGFTHAERGVASGPRCLISVH